MTDSFSDFENKLYSIKPFKETESPSSSNRKQSKQAVDLETLPDITFKISEALSFTQRPSQPETLRRTLSMKIPYQQGSFEQKMETYGDSNNRTITSISSTIDMLFSKIQRIKEEFSYALEKPHSESQIKNYGQEDCSDKIFYSDKYIQEGIYNKENQAFIPHQKDKEHPKIIHCHSLPLQQHTQNSYTVHSDISNFEESTLNDEKIQDKFCNFQEERIQNQRQKLKIGDFHLGRCIGSGKFGDVYQCIHKKTGFMCAIKKIFKSTIGEYNMHEQLITELKIHYKLDHPNIIQLYGHFDDEYHFFLMMEYACEGSLMDRLKGTQQYVSRSVDQMLDAVNYMHRNKVVHRDIKPQNIVLSIGSTVKICDFGWASVLENSMKHTFCGTLDYVSPEMKDVGQYNQSVDLWSIGVLTFELIAGFPPYKHQISNWKLFGSKRKMKWSWEVIYPPEINPIPQLFIQKLLKQNPAERSSICQCKCSPFIARYKTEVKCPFYQQFQDLFI